MVWPRKRRLHRKNFGLDPLIGYFCPGHLLLRPFSKSRYQEFAMHSTPTKVLITGLRGMIARATLAELRREPAKFEVHGVDTQAELWDDRQRGAGQALPADRLRIADFSDFHEVRQAVQGMDVVLVLDENDDLCALQNLFKACVDASVGRVIYASSAMVCWGYTEKEPYRAIREGRFDDLPTAVPMLTTLSEPRPSEEVTGKLWGEALGKRFADAHGLSVCCLRFGWINERDTPWDPQLASLWCSQRDAVQMVRRCIAGSDGGGFDIFFVLSANRRRWLDTDDALDRLGYVPMDGAVDTGHGPERRLACVA
jgi:nucleoside-diphosphate-sugar epimerase